MNEDVSLEQFESAVSDVLFFSIGEGAVVFNNKGIITRVNKAAQDILGYTRDELLGKWFPGLVIAEDEEGEEILPLDRPSTEVFVTGKTVVKKVYYRKKDGGRVPVAINVSPIVYEGKPLGAIEVFRDITEEMQLEQAKDEFISIASHQLRTPATAVKQYLGLILQGFITDPTQQRMMIETAYEQNENQLDIINQLLRVARAESSRIKVKPVETDMVAFLRKIADEQEQMFADKNIPLHFEQGKKRVNCYIDRLHMRMVFENLLHNAYKYSPKGKPVKIEVDSTQSNVVVKIIDKGHGIDESDIPRLFRRFSRGEKFVSTTDGTGLGLYWAKKLVNVHDGDIDVSSIVGEGSTFSVTFPKKLPA